MGSRSIRMAAVILAVLLWAGLAGAQAEADEKNSPSEKAGTQWHCPKMGMSMGQPRSRGEEGSEGWFCPWCGRGRGYGGYGRGRGMMGPGMMGPDGRGRGMMGRGMRGRGMGPGMMGPGYGQGRQGYGWDDRYGENTDPLSQDQARLLVENYLRNRGNPNLKLGELTEEEGYYEASILTKEGSLVDKLHVDKQTGWFRSAYDR